jgi:aspartate racemase
MDYKKTIGILGGMGPAATVDFFDKIVKAAKVNRDQDHPRIIIDNNPKIPDRTAAILDNGPDPLPVMVQSAKFLEQAHVDFIVIPCVTAHFFHEKLQKQISTPILHLVKETVKHLLARHPAVVKIGLLATSGTIQSGLFNEACAAANVELITPTKEIQTTKVMEAIYSIKATGSSATSKALAREAAETLIRRGAQAIIAGCTEVPLVLVDGDLSVPVIDPLAVLAERAVMEAR